MIFQIEYPLNLWIYKKDTEQNWLRASVARTNSIIPFETRYMQKPLVFSNRIAKTDTPIAVVMLTYAKTHVNEFGGFKTANKQPREGAGED